MDRDVYVNAHKLKSSANPEQKQEPAALATGSHSGKRTSPPEAHRHGEVGSYSWEEEVNNTGCNTDAHVPSSTATPRGRGLSLSLDW